MGEVLRPKDILQRRGKPALDLTPKPVPRPSIPRNIDDVLREIESLKAEIANIKRVLRVHGINIE